jgi:hypothetical protein
MRCLVPLVGLFVLAGCPGPDGSLPAELWLTFNQNESGVRLTDQEPEPF